VICACHLIFIMRSIGLTTVLITASRGVLLRPCPAIGDKLTDRSASADDRSFCHSTLLQRHGVAAAALCFARLEEYQVMNVWLLLSAAAATSWNHHHHHLAIEPAFPVLAFGIRSIL